MVNGAQALRHGPVSLVTTLLRRVLLPCSIMAATRPTSATRGLPMRGPIPPADARMPTHRCGGLIGGHGRQLILRATPTSCGTSAQLQGWSRCRSHDAAQEHRPEARRPSARNRAARAAMAPVDAASHARFSRSEGLVRIARAILRVHVRRLRS